MICDFCNEECKTGVLIPMLKPLCFCLNCLLKYAVGNMKTVKEGWKLFKKHCQLIEQQHHLSREIAIIEDKIKGVI